MLLKARANGTSSLSSSLDGKICGNLKKKGKKKIEKNEQRLQSTQRK